MGKFYISLTYACNHWCISCPIDRKKRTIRTTRFHQIVEIIEVALKSGQFNPFEDHIELSGGEPTLHPDFFPLIQYLTSDLGVKINILSNATMFSKKEFLEKFLRIYRGNIQIITALYSHDCEIHNCITKRKNSFQLTTSGLNYLVDSGIKVSLKTIIQKMNYECLPELAEMIITKYPQVTFFSFHSMDVRGMALENQANTLVRLSLTTPYLENALEKFEKVKKAVRVYSFPLCLIDPYYWKYLSVASKSITKAYRSPDTDTQTNLTSDSGTEIVPCKQCALEIICPGVWYSYIGQLGFEELTPFRAIGETT